MKNQALLKLSPLLVNYLFLLILLCCANTKLLAGGAPIVNPNWDPIPSGVNANLNAAYFVSPTNGFIVGTARTIIKTQDRGNSWNTVLSGSGQLRAVDFPNPDTGYVVGFDGIDGLVLKTTDKGVSWVQKSIAGQLKMLYGVQFANTNIGYVVGQQGTIMKTIDGGTTWSLLTSLLIDELFGLWVFNANEVIVVGAGGKVSKTPDGGQTWNPITTNTSKTLTSINFFNNDSVGIATAYNGTIFRTADKGDTWTEIATGITPHLFASAYRSKSQPYVVGDVGSILKSNDGGFSWVIDSVATPTNFRTVIFADTMNANVGGNMGFLMKIRQAMPPFQCNADFNYKNDTVNPKIVSFTNTSPGVQSQVLWDFGDGKSGFGNTPVNAYATRDEFTVCMTIIDSVSADTCAICKPIRSGICGVKYVAYPDSTSPMKMHFEDKSVGTFNNRVWDFGDGTQDSIAITSHTYAAPGRYIVCLSRVDPDFLNPCSDCRFIAVGQPPPTKFTFSGQLHTKNPLPLMGPKNCPKQIFSRLDLFNNGTQQIDLGQCTFQNARIFELDNPNDFKLDIKPMFLTLNEKFDNLNKMVYLGGQMTILRDTTGTQDYKSILQIDKVSTMMQYKCPDSTIMMFYGKIVGGESGLVNEFMSNYNTDEIQGIITSLSPSAGSFNYVVDIVPAKNNRPIVGMPIIGLGPGNPINFSGTGVNMVFNSFQPGGVGDTSTATVIHNHEPPLHAPPHPTVSTIFNNSYWAIGATIDTFDVEVCFDFDPADFNVSNLSNFTCVYQPTDGDPWETISSTPTLTDSTICFTTDHLSNWAIAITKPDAKAAIDTVLYNPGAVDAEFYYDFPNAAVDIRETLSPGEKDTVLFNLYDINPGGDLPDGLVSFNEQYWEFDGSTQNPKTIQFDLSKIADADTNGKQTVLYRPDAVSDWVELPSSRVKKGMKEALYIRIDTSEGHFALAKTISGRPAFDVTVNVTEGCPGETTLFFTTVSGGIPPYSYSWTGDSSFISTQSNPTYVFPSGATNYAYELEVKDSIGAIVSFQNSVGLNKPTAQFQVSMLGLDVTFKDSSLNASSWSWDFGDGATSTLQNPTHTYAVLSNYTVTLIASSACGTDTLKYLIDFTSDLLENNISGKPFKIIPNPFRDKTNIYYVVEKSSKVTLEIYNMLGQKMNTLVNNETQEGTYVYEVNSSVLNNGISKAVGMYMIRLAIKDKVYVARIVDFKN